MIIVDLTTIFEKQKKLDSAILKKHYHNKETIFSNRVLALLVELAEFANEGKEFKYWSLKKQNINRDSMLEEYIDCLHFLSTICIQFDVNPLVEIKPCHHSKKLTILENLFNVISNMFNEIIVSTTYVTYVLHEFIRLGFASGFNKEEIFQMYNYKNAINYKRLKEGY